MSGENKGNQPATGPAPPPKDPSEAFPPDDTNYTKYYDFVVKELDKGNKRSNKKTKKRNSGWSFFFDSN